MVTEDGGVLPPPPKADLCVPRYSFDTNNRMKLESKDDIKARGMRSPDIAEALALTVRSLSLPPVAASDHVGRAAGEADIQSSRRSRCPELLLSTSVLPVVSHPAKSRNSRTQSRSQNEG
jgi:hypothetical protein